MASRPEEFQPLVEPCTHEETRALIRSLVAQGRSDLVERLTDAWTRAQLDLLERIRKAAGL